jgi:hypothetical protein
VCRRQREFWQECSSKKISREFLFSDSDFIPQRRQGAKLGKNDSKSCFPFSLGVFAPLREISSPIT